MDIIQKALVFDNQVTVSVLSVTEAVNTVTEKLGLSDLAQCAMARMLAAGAYMSSELKGKGEKLSISVNGKGGLGKMVVAADSGVVIRGTLEHPDFTLPKLSNGKENIRQGVGNDGFLNVIKDLGLKEPYVANTQLATGELSEDFAWYYTNSEQRPMAIALDAKVNDGKCVAAGGIYIEPLPNCPDHIITILEDISMNFADFAELLEQKTPLEILQFYFGHFEIEYLQPIPIIYKCKCSREVMENVIISLGRNDCVNLLMQRGTIDITCDFCKTLYSFSKDDVIDIWRRYDNRPKS